MELDPQPGRDHEQGGGAGLRKLDFFRFMLFLNSSATDIVLVTLPSTAVQTAIARCTSRWAMARGHRLNTSIVLAASTVSPVFFGRYPRLSLHSFVPFPLSPFLIIKQPRFCGRKATWSRSRQQGQGQFSVCTLWGHFSVRNIYGFEQ